jgi:hypothetical protein
VEKISSNPTSSKEEIGVKVSIIYSILSKMPLITETKMIWPHLILEALEISFLIKKLNSILKNDFKV